MRFFLFCTTVLLCHSHLYSAEKNELAQSVLEIFRNRCYRCHGAELKADGLEILDHRIVVADNGDNSYIVPRNADASYVWRRIAGVAGYEQDMPPRKVLPDGLPKEELDKIREWIDAGAPKWEVATDRKFVSEEAILTAIDADLRKNIDRENRKFIRYFSITHLHNNPGVSDSQLRLYRAALSKALNCMSRTNSIVVPIAANQEGTIYRIDLRSYGWDDISLWDKVAETYPYGLKPVGDSENGEKLRRYEDIRESYGNFAGDKFPYMRADWFVVTATRPPLYHILADIPEDLSTLYSVLKINPEEDFQNNKAKRAGMLKSGVSTQNRLVEYHEDGLLWISYDFFKNSGRSSLPQRPLGPKFASGRFKEFERFAFEQDGGEIIWELRNGLHAYMLIDKDGKRIDKGPPEIVYDPSLVSGSPLIVNGVSCIACHTNGLHPLKDDIRTGHAVVADSAIQKISQLYPRREEMTEKIDERNAEFSKALKKATGIFFEDGKQPPVEPVRFVAEQYDKNVDLTVAARELGIEDDDVLKSRLNDVDLRKLGLGPLERENGTIKRGFWESRESGNSVLQNAALELNIATPAH